MRDGFPAGWLYIEQFTAIAENRAKAHHKETNL